MQNDHDHVHGPAGPGRDCAGERVLYYRSHAHDARLLCPHESACVGSKKLLAVSVPPKPQNPDKVARRKVSRKSL